MISVILPCYNCEYTVQIALDSLNCQTEPDIEVIAVDDGSTDKTRKILEVFSEKDRHFHVLHQSHTGIVTALNRGLKQARGKYIARMDSDDVSKPGRLSLQREFLDNHSDTGLVSCCVEYSGDKERNRGYYEYVKWTNTIITNEQISLSRFIESPFAHPTIMFRKALVEKYGGYLDGPFPEDYELWLRYLERGVRMEKISHKLLVWNDSKDRLSRLDPRYSPEAFYRIKAKYLSNWLKTNNPYHPDVIVWGAGRTARKRAELLAEYGIKISGYVDIDPKKIGRKYQQRKVISQDELSDSGDCFIVPYVASRGARKEISAFLSQQGYVPGKHFIFAA